MSFRGLGIEDSERIEAQSGLVELLGELGLPCSCRIERLVLDAVEVRRELHPLLVERAHPFPAERGDREAELEDDVLAGARPELPRPGGKPSHVVARQQGHDKGDGPLRLELLDEGAPPARLLVQENGLELELHQKARDLLLGFHVSPVDEQDLVVRRRHAAPHRGDGSLRLRLREPQAVRNGNQVPDLGLHDLDQVRGGWRAAPVAAAADRSEVTLPDLVGRDEEPQQPCVALAPRLVVVGDRLVSSRLQAPRERQAALNLEREEPGVQAWRGRRGRDRLGGNLRQFASLRRPPLANAAYGVPTRAGSVRTLQARENGRLPRSAAVTPMTARYKLEPGPRTACASGTKMQLCCAGTVCDPAHRICPTSPGSPGRRLRQRTRPAGSHRGEGQGANATDAARPGTGRPAPPAASAGG